IAQKIWSEGGAPMNTQPWKIDGTCSSIRFAVRHLVVAKILGQFRSWNADLAIDESDLTRSSVNVTIDAGSVDTGNKERDAHLAAPHFLHATEFPVLTFRSRRIERARDDSYRVIGDLTMRGVTREVTLDAQLGGFVIDPWGGRRTGF